MFTLIEISSNHFAVLHYISEIIRRLSFLVIPIITNNIDNISDNDNMILI